MGDFGEGTDVALHQRAIPGLKRTNIQNHVQFVCAQAQGLKSFKALDRCEGSAQGKINHGADLHPGVA